MDNTALYVMTFLVEVVITGFVIAKRSPFARTPFHMMVYLLACQIVFFLLYCNWIDNNEGSPGRLMAEVVIPDKAFFMYVQLFCFFLVTELLCPPIKVDLSAGKLSGGLDLSRYAGAITFISAGALALAIVQMASRDWSLVWESYKYGAMAGAAGDNLDFPASSVIRTLFHPVGFLCFLLLGVAGSIKARGAVVLLIVPCLWYYMFFVSAGSRSAAVAVFVYAAVGYLLSKEKSLLRLALVSAFGVFTTIAVLVARSRGDFGISNFPGIMTLPFEASEGLSIAVLNLMQGAVVAMDGLLVRGEHLPKYEILSVSPFPSVIDGFDAIRVIGELRLHLFVPMGGITEVIRFGPRFIVGVGIAYMAMIRYVNSRSTLKDLGPLVVLGANLLITMYCVMAFSYPLRNTFRQIIYLTVALFIIRFIKREIRAANLRKGPPQPMLRTQRGMQPQRGMSPQGVMSTQVMAQPALSRQRVPQRGFPQRGLPR